MSEHAPNSTQPKPSEANRRRSERVVLRIALTLSTTMPDGKRFRGPAHTEVVNAHGGLLDVGTEMSVGQKMLLSNPKTEKIEVCRAIRVDHTDDRFLVAFEFDVPAPQFWPISFPPEDWQMVPAGKGHRST